MSQTPDSAATGGAEPSDGVTSDVPRDDAGSSGVSDEVIGRHDERHEGSAFAGGGDGPGGGGDVPRAPAATTRPYPPEADPEPDVVVPEAEVPGEQTDPARRREVFPEDEAAAAAGTAGSSMPSGTEPPD